MPGGARPSELSLGDTDTRLADTRPAVTVPVRLHSLPSRAPNTKLAELDAVRGLAALVVFNMHAVGGVRADVLAWLGGTPFYGLANGGAAVMLFFVLSGFVLTLAPLRAGRAGRLAGPALRRYPRLAGPVVMAGLAAVLLARAGGFPGTAWIGPRLGELFPRAMMWGSQMHDDAAWPVLRQAAYGAFFQGAADHNPVLWTMHWELLGSVVALGLALLLLLPVPRALRLGGALLLAGLAVRHSMWLVGFPVGVAGALGHARFGHARRLSPRAAGLLFCAAGFVMSWNIDRAAGAWRWADHLPPWSRDYLWAFAQSAAGAGMLAVAMYCAPVRAALRTAPLRALGRLCFSLYLTHILVLLSLGAWTCLAVFPGGVGLVWLPGYYVAMLAAACVVAVPLAAFDAWWIGVLVRVTPR